MILGSLELKGLTGHEAGRMLLKDLWQTHIGGTMPEIAVTERGKPYFIGGQAHFSISHTQKHVFCALFDRPVGLDAEETDRKIHFRLADKILSATEKVRFDAAADQHAALLKLWVLKEAAGKLTGAGINGYPDKTEFSLDDPRVTESHGCYVAVVESDK